MPSPTARGSSPRVSECSVRSKEHPVRERRPGEHEGRHERVLPQLALAAAEAAALDVQPATFGPERERREAEEESQRCGGNGVRQNTRGQQPRERRLGGDHRARNRGDTAVPGHERVNRLPKRVEAPGLRAGGNGEHNRYCEPQRKRENEHATPSLTPLATYKDRSTTVNVQVRGR